MQRKAEEKKLLQLWNKRTIKRYGAARAKGARKTREAKDRRGRSGKKKQSK